MSEETTRRDAYQFALDRALDLARAQAQWSAGDWNEFALAMANVASTAIEYYLAIQGDKAD